MINKDFIKNWKKILTYNEKVRESSDEDKFIEDVRIPLTPIKTNTKLIYNLFKFIYPEIINDQQNIVDIIISNDEKKILDLILYETNKPGIHESYKKLDLDLIKAKKYTMENINEFFNKLQKKILKKKKIRISHIRIFKAEFINLINDYLKNIEKLPTNDFLFSFFSIIEKSIRSKIFYIYPKPIIINFLEEILSFFKEFTFSGLYSYVKKVLPKLNFIILFHSNNFSFIVEFKKKHPNSNSKIELNIYQPDDLGFNFDNLAENEILKLIHNKFKKSNIYIFEQKRILNILNDLFELEIPLRKDKLKLLLQKILFEFRNFEISWFKYPKPKIYGTLPRFLIRILGFNYNLKKFSHWAIPELIFKSDYSLGFNNKIIIILTNIKENGKLKYNNTFLLESEENSIFKIQQLSINEIIKEPKSYQLEDLRNKLSEKYGYINTIIKIDRYLVDLFLNDFIFKITKFKLFSKLKIIRAFKKDSYLKIYPEIPIYKFLKKSSSFRIFKTLLPILIDKHEF